MVVPTVKVAEAFDPGDIEAGVVAESANVGLVTVTEAVPFAEA